MCNENEELRDIKVQLHYILQEFRMMNMISLEKWDNKIEGYDGVLNDTDTRSVVRDQIRFFQSGYDDIIKKQKEFYDERDKLWEARNSKKAVK